MVGKTRHQFIVDGVNDTERLFGTLRRDLQGTDKAAAALSRTLAGMAVSLVGAIGVGAMANTLRSFESLRASLKTVTGSTEAASMAFDELQEFTARTPFQLDQVVDAFIKLKALGLEPSQEALESYGNTASATGKDLIQFIEAVADSATFQFERLREFGIVAASEGDKVAFTFQGVTTEVEKNADAIVGFLREIGDTNFAGASAERAATLDGALSNLEDSVSSLVLALGDAGLTDALDTGARGLADMADIARQMVTDFGAAETAVEGLTDAISGFLLARDDEQQVEQLRVREKALVTNLGFLERIPVIGDQLAEKARAELQSIRAQIDTFEAIIAGRRAADERLPGASPSPPASSSATGSSAGGGSASTKAAEKAEADLQKAILKTRQLMVEQEAETAELNAKLAEDADELTRRLRDNQQDRVNNLVQSLATEEEELARKLQNDLQLLELAKANELQILGGFEEAKKRLVEQNAQAVAELQQRQLDETANANKAAFEDLEDAIRGFGNEATQAIVDFATTGKLEVGQLVESILADFARMAVQRSITGPLFDALSGALGGGASGSGGGGIGSFFSGLFGGARAEGGPVSAGRAYLVGEQGPELLVPRSSGTVLPNSSSLQGGGEASVVVNVTVPPGSEVERSESRGADGERVIDIAVLNSLGRMSGSGELDRVFRQFGSTRKLPGR